MVHCPLCVSALNVKDGRFVVEQAAQLITEWKKAGSVLSLSVLLCVPAPAALVRELIAFSRRCLLQEGSEGGAYGAATERLLHAEVVHHALLHFLLCWGKKEAAKDSQLQRENTRVMKGMQTLKQVSPYLLNASSLYYKQLTGSNVSQLSECFI